jgi:ribosomal protein L11 methylase PrmA
LVEATAPGSVIFEPDPASFRDPAGRIFKDGTRVVRAISHSGIDNWVAVRDSSTFISMVERGWVVASKPVAIPAGETPLSDAAAVISHPRLPFISHPFEWCFEALKTAALHHLDVHIEALGSDITLADASAYNIQFIGSRPIFIDALSFRPYVAGSVWDGYRQFCEQFLYPLLLESTSGINANAWYRGTIEGLSARQIRRMLPLRYKFSPKVWKHVILPDILTGAITTDSLEDAGRQLGGHGIPKTSLINLLRGIRGWIETLQRYGGATTWDKYSSAVSYNQDATQAKHMAVSEFVSEISPDMLWDIGCNQGEFSLVACKAGAKYVVGWDLDVGAVNQAFLSARECEAPFTPLLIDIANPTPSQGWAQTERPGMAERGPADAVLALALVHHLAIGRNIPIPHIVSWLTQNAHSGLVEFVPKEDPQVKRMLALRNDIFPHYDKESFASALSQHARIERVIQVGETGRELFWFTRDS